MQNHKFKYSKFLLNKNYNFNRQKILDVCGEETIDDANKVISGWENYEPTPLLNFEKLSKDLKYLTPPPNATLIEELKSCEAISFVLYRLSTWEKKAAGVAWVTDDVATIKKNIKRVVSDNPGMFDDFLELV